MTRHCKPMTDLSQLVRKPLSSGLATYKRNEPTVKRDAPKRNTVTVNELMTRNTARIAGMNYGETR